MTGDWTVDDAIETYGVERWSQGMFTVNERGHISLRTTGDNPDVDLAELVEAIRLRGMSLPVLLRFTDILRRRLDDIAGAFSRAFEAHGYEGLYRGVYPIKVNQHRHVLEDLIRLGKRHHFGLEAGSKAELLVAIAMLSDPEALLICNGFKDRDYTTTALAARQLGQKIYLVVEKPSELPVIVDVARELGVAPLIGVRTKLLSSGAGRWARSSGERSKFGLRAAEVVDAVRYLRRRKMLQHLRLMHFHVGSQVSDIQALKEAFREASALFAELRRMGAPIDVVDVGGGLAVDYDGSHTSFESSANYTLDEYASDVVEALAQVCEERDLPHPTVVSESGRAIAAHHSVLVVEALSRETSPADLELPPLPKRIAQPVRRMEQLRQRLAADNVQKTFHSAVQARAEANMLFNLRHLSLEDLARVERTFRFLCHLISVQVQHLPYVPDELEELEDQLAVTYYCNFSLFQSLPDHWAIKQLFPVVPLHRLDERPTLRGVIADITCDSDGTIDRFVDLEDVSATLALHDLDPEQPYHLGIFMVGAYQEVLGDLHNLFGDTNVVHVSSGPTGFVIDRTVEGDSIVDVLSYLMYNRRQLLGQVRRRVEAALVSGAMTLEQSAPFVRDIESRLDDYTYLQPTHGRSPRRAR